MRARIIAVVVAAVLAVAGAAALVFAVQTSAQSAAAGTRMQTVLVVMNPIAAGTPGDEVGDSVAEEQIPAEYVAPGAVSDRSALDGLIALVGLEPGEQMLASRWGTATDLVAGGGRVDAPSGTQEISLALDLERVAGGAIGPGSEVGVYGSTGGTTTLLLDHVLVTAIASTVAADDNAGTTSGTVLVTLAVTADQAVAVIQAAEFGEVWLSKQESR